MISKEKIIANVNEILNDKNITEPPIHPEIVCISSPIHLLVKKLPDEISSIFDGTNPQELLIIVNDKHVEANRRFSIAHSIGHIRLHYEKNVITKDTGIHVDTSFFIEKGSHNIDVEASLFAAELLMPEKMIINSFEKLISREDDFINKLAELYHVSTTAMCIRLEYLGLLKLQADSLFIKKRM